MKKVLTYRGHHLEYGNPKYISPAFGRYCDSSDERLGQVYDTWSDEKQEAYENTKKIQKELDGYDYRIISHNGWAFTCGFKFKMENVVYFCYITANHTRYIEVSKCL